MNGEAKRRRRDRVLHVLQHDRPAFNGEDAFLDRASAAMQELAPGVEHDLLVTRTPAPADPAACSTLGRITYLCPRPLGALARHLRLAWWMLLHLPRYCVVHVHAPAGRPGLGRVPVRLLGRRLVLPATADAGPPAPGPMPPGPMPAPGTRRPAPVEGPPLLPRGIAAPPRAPHARPPGPGTQPGGRPGARDTPWQGCGLRGIAARQLGLYGLADRMVGQAVSDLPETGLGCAASVIDPRFHAPLDPAPGAVPLLLTTVDAEEAFDWSGPFSRDAVDVRSMASQHLAHRVFDRHGVVPVYLVDYPVAAQDRGRAPLRELLRDGRCDIGAQLHPWVTPPFLERVGEHNSYVGNLPAALEYEKARRLTGTIAESFGVVPRIYRTGRFGAGPRTGDILKRLGYLVDSSVSVCWPAGDTARRRGHWPVSARPHWIDRERTLLEVPASAGLVGRLAARHGGRLAPVAFHPVAQRLAVSAALSRLGLLERIRLSPEGMTIGEAKRLVRHMLAEGHRVFVLTYHSPSLAPGNTPYTRSADDVRRFLDWLDAFYTFFREEAGGRPATWQEVRFGPGATAAREGATGRAADAAAGDAALGPSLGPSLGSPAPASAAAWQADARLRRPAAAPQA